MKPHKRKCWDCGNVAEHEDNVIPHVLCKTCGSQDTRPVKSPTYQCLNANCGGLATHARVMTGCVQPLCGACARMMERYGSKVVPIEQAIIESRD